MCLCLICQARVQLLNALCALLYTVLGIGLGPDFLDRQLHVNGSTDLVCDQVGILLLETVFFHEKIRYLVLI